MEWATPALCAATALGGGTAYFTVSGPHRGTLWEATLAALLALMALGVFRTRHGSRRGWVALWLGLLSAYVGGVIAAHPQLVAFDVRSPSIVDVLKLANYPLAAIGVLVLMSRADRRIGGRAVLESALLTAAGSLVIWDLVATSILEQDHSGLARATALAYPLMDVLLLGVLATLALHLRGAPGSLYLVGLALAGNLAADVAFGHQSLAGTYRPGGWIDAGWLICFAALALAPSWPAPRKVALHGDDGRLGAGRAAALLAGGLLAPAIVAGHVASGSEIPAVVAVGSVTVVGLAMCRMIVFNRDLDQSREQTTVLAAELRVKNEHLARARSEQRRLLDRVHRLIEEERTRIAAEIHDRPLQQLVAVSYQLELMSQLLRQGNIERSSTVCDQAASGLAEQLTALRMIMTDIRPPVLDASGLFGALTDRARQLSAEHAPTTFTVVGRDIELDPDVEVALYRVAQESLTNAVRHAAATIVTVSLDHDGYDAQLTVADNGRGFDTDLDVLVPQGHFGIVGMRERVQLLGGAMRIESGRSGTTMSFTIPKDPAARELAQFEALLEVGP